MPNRFQGQARIAAFAFILAAAAGQYTASAQDRKSIYFGRWSVDDPTDKFSANGKLYRQIDIAPCGKDFCGVRVEGGACGATLFRFLAIHANVENLAGHGKWGSAEKKLFALMDESSNALNLSLGDASYNPNSRSGSVPTFTAQYHRIGDAQCTTGEPGT